MDESSPFEAPGEPEMISIPLVNPIDAIRDGSLNALANLHRIAGAYLVLGVIYAVSLCTCVGWVVLGPFLLWGFYLFFVRIADGNAQITDTLEEITSDRKWLIWTRGWGMVGLLLLLGLPNILVALFGPLAAGVDPVEVSTNTSFIAINLISGTIWGALIVPFSYGPYIMVDRDLGPLESMSLALHRMRHSWVNLAAITVAASIIASPFSVGISMVSPTITPSGATPDLSALVPLGGLYIGMMLVAAVTICWYAAAYRQVFPASED